MFSKPQLLFIILLLLFTRYFGLFWGNGFFFHPDENNMASALSTLSPINSNPGFFAYGQFPLYLGYILLRLLHLPNNFVNSVYILRFISATASCFSFYYFLGIYKKLLPKYFTFLPSLFFIFSPGLIQLSHFGTTEGLIIFFFLAIIYYSFENKFLPVGLLLGLAVGVKVSSFIFVAFPMFIIMSSKYKLLNFIKLALFFPISYFLSSPYNFINWPDFVSSMQYETSVAAGKLAVFYTSQFQSTQPYLFQLQKIFPFAWGLPTFFLFWPALFYFLLTHKSKKIIPLLLVCLLFFLYFGQIYVKWFRFMSPIFFLPYILVPVFIQNFRSKFMQFLLSALCILPGFIFMYRYFNPDIRVQASSWIASNLKGNILSEDRNVVSIPFNPKLGQNIINFNFYDLDTNPLLASKLATDLTNADYILVPSRRVFANQNNPSFPNSKRYYSSLFSGTMGFKLLKEFSLYPNWLNDELLSEETFTVFDNPTIRVYGKI